MQRRSIIQSIKRSNKAYSLLICLLGYLFIGLFSQAHAQAVSLRVSPSVLQIKADTPTEINAPISIENLSENSIILGVKFKLFKAGARENGELEYLKDADNHSDILNKTQLIEGEQAINELKLGPHQKKTLNLKISLNENEFPSDSDYYFSVVFINQASKNPSEHTSISNLRAGIAMNVLLSVKPSSLPAAAEQLPSATLEEFSAPLFTQHGPLPFTIKVSNTTSEYISPKGTILIKNMFGQTIGKVDVPAQNILAHSSRYLVTEDQLITYNSSLITPKAVWPEKFLLGFYEANLSLKLSDKGPTLTKTIHFTAFPSEMAFWIILIMVALFLIYKRVKAKMS